MLRFLRYLGEFIAGVVGIVILLVFLLAWRLSSHPITSDFLTPYIEEGIESIVPGTDAHIATSTLTWDNVQHSLALHTDDIKLYNNRGAEIADLPVLDARVSPFGLLLGQFLPKELRIEQPQIQIEHRADGSFVFGDLAIGDTGERPSDKPRPLKDILHNILGNLSHAALLNNLSVTKAVINVHDDITHGNWAVKIPEISINHTLATVSAQKANSGALEGHIFLEATQKDATATLDVHYAYDPVKQQHDLSTHIDGLTPAFLADGHPETLGLAAAASVNLPISGEVEAAFNRDFDLSLASIHLDGGAGTLIDKDLWDTPCPVKSLSLNADYNRQENRLSISNTHVDLDGPIIAMDARGSASQKSGFDLDFVSTVQIDHMPMNSYNLLWPKPVLEHPRYWLAANLRDGMFNHAEAAVKGSLALADLDKTEINEVKGKLSASGARVTYMQEMTPATNVSADATFDLTKMLVTLKSGDVGAIKLAPFTLQIDNLSGDSQTIQIPLQVSGPIPDILRLLDEKPLGYSKKLGIAPDDITGSIQGEVDFKFPLLRDLQTKDLDIRAAAQAGEVASTQLVPGVAISHGNLAMKLDMNGLNLTGQAELDKILFQVAFQQNFAPAAGKMLQQVDLTGVIHDDQWANLGIKVFDGTKGPINAVFHMQRPGKKRMQFSGTLDMTPADVSIAQLGWHKMAGIPARLQYAAEAPDGKPVAITSLELHGQGIDVSGRASLSPDLKQLLSLDLTPVKLGRTNAVLHFSQSFGTGGALRFDAEGEALDISGFRNGTGSTAATDTPDAPDTRPQQYRFRLDRFYTGANGEIDIAQGSAVRDMQGWSAIDLSGIVGDGKKLDIHLTPQPDGHRVFSIQCDNFGDAMKGLGFTDAIEGGRLDVSGQSSVDDPQKIKGSASITAFTVHRLPVLALLLNATSPFGFKDILTDSADFSRMKGSFIWQGDQLTVEKAHAAGSAVGLNADGIVNLNTGNADLQGTVVPFSMMNKAVNYLPVIGKLITGGDDQGVLAVAYTIKGPLGSPQISVNPVSLLTPGFLRNLFFRDEIGDKNVEQTPKL